MSKRPRGEDTELSAADMAALLEGGSEIPSLDVSGVKRLLLGVERAITANRTLRVKHAGEPLKYLDSEVGLDTALKGLQALAAAPEHYGVLVGSGTLPSLLDLLTHENVDISSSVVSLLAELLGEEEAGEDAAGLEAASRRALLQALHAAGALELICHTAARFHASATAAAAAAASSATQADNAARDSEALLATLELLQSALALRPDLAAHLCAMQPPVLLATLLARLLPASSSASGVSALEEGRFAASELLAVLVMPGGGALECAKAVGAGCALGGSSSSSSSSGGAVVTGIEALLQALAEFRRRAPAGAAEEEFIGNVFDTLCSCLLVPENRAFFLASEGCELMLRLIREAGFARHGALRMLSYACLDSSSEGSSSSSSSSSPAPDTLRPSIACAIIQAGALKHLFPAFMGLGAAHTRKVHGQEEARQEEEYCVSILEALLAALPAGSAGSPGMERLRLVAKFAEDRGVKAQRLVELRLKYAARVQRALEREEEGEEEEEKEEEGDAASALTTLQRIDLIIGRLLVEGSSSSSSQGAAAAAPPAAAVAAAARVRADTAFTLRSKLHEQGCSLVSTLESLSGYAQGLEGSASSEGERVAVLGMMAALAEAWGLEAGEEAEGEGEGGKQ